MVYHWGREIEKHSDKSYSIVVGEAQEKIDRFCMDADFTVVSHSWFSQVLNKRNGRIIEKLKDFDMLLIDEAHLVKNHKTTGFNMYCRYLLNIKRRYLMTGTPIGQDSTGIFSLYYLLDRGLTFGDNFYKFTRRYFNIFMVRQKYPRYTLKEHLQQEFIKRFWSKQIRWEEGECLHLESMNKVILPVEMTREQWRDYRIIVAESKDEDTEKEDVLYDLMKITAGIGFSKSPKMEMLIALIEECVVSGKDQVIVWCWMMEESNYILHSLSKHFSKLNIQAVRGDTSPQQANFILDSWKKGEVDVLIGNVKSIGIGIDLFEANKAVYWSNSFSLIDRKQAEKRIHRLGQTRQCYQIDLVAMKTIDEKIYDRLSEVRTGFDETLGDAATQERIK